MSDMSDNVEKMFEGRNPKVVQAEHGRVEIEVDPVGEQSNTMPVRPSRPRPRTGVDAQGNTIERTADLRGHGVGRYGDVLAGGVPDADRRTIVVESVGNSGANANKVLHSDFPDSGNGIRGGRASSDIAVEQRSRLHGDGVYERTPETTKRRELTDEERLAALRRRVPESMVIEVGGRRPESIKTESERAAEVRAKLTGRR